MASSQIDRPFVFRALIPLLSRELTRWTHLHLAYSVMVWVVLSAIGLYFAVRYLRQAFDQDPARSSLAAFLCSELFLFLMLQDPREYDFATAFFFTLSLAFLAHGKARAYLLLFPIATINRESTLLLSVFWAVSSFRTTKPLTLALQGAYQAVVYLLIRLMVGHAFSQNPGSPFVWTFPQNITTFVSEPAKTSILILLFVMGVWIVLHRWRDKPAFLRLAFWVIFPPLVVLHLLVGLWWEVRVYAELFPVLILLALWGTLPSRATQPAHVPLRP